MEPGPGDVGTVVHVYRDGQAYEVKFVTSEGHTAAVATLEAWRSPTRENCARHRDRDQPHFALDRHDDLVGLLVKSSHI